MLGQDAAAPVLQIFGERDVLAVSERRLDKPGSPVRVLPFTPDLPNLLVAQWKKDVVERKPAPVLSLTAAAELFHSSAHVSR